MAERVKEACGGNLTDKKIAVLGLTFKPNTDDMRDSPSLDIIPALTNEGASIVAFDPAGMEEAQKLLTGIEYCEGPYQAVDGADAVVIITEWDEFRALDLNKLKELMTAPVMVDLRNIYKPTEMARNGFEYYSIGRPQ